MKLQNSCLLAGAIFVCGMTSISYAQEKLEDVGIVFNDGTNLNKKIVDVVKYVGTCPGWYSENVIGWFRHKEVPTKKGRRVRIVNEKFRNITNKVPYTDRKYTKNDSSQIIGFDFDTSHRGSKFVIKPGVNQFTYLIYDGKYGKSNMQTIKKGSFSVEVNSKVREYQRDIEWRSNLYFVCLNQKGEIVEEESLDNCQYPAAQELGSCNGEFVYGKIRYLDRYEN